jgi:hypothetical protein
MSHPKKEGRTMTEAKGRWQEYCVGGEFARLDWFMCKGSHQERYGDIFEAPKLLTCDEYGETPTHRFVADVAEPEAIRTLSEVGK